MTGNLFHISSKLGIRVFEPRNCMNPLTGRNENLVWAIDEEHVQNYLLPRDCPRVTFYADRDTAAKDIERLMCGTTAKHVIAVESAWLERIRGDVVYEYSFDPTGFRLVDETAGYYVSKMTAKPRSIRRVSDMLAELFKHDVELRVMPSLWELREELIRSTMQYSIIRMRNAAPPAKGLRGFHPLPE